MQPFLQGLQRGYSFAKSTYGIMVYIYNNHIDTTTKITNLFPARDEMYSIQLYVIKACQWLGGFIVSFNNTMDDHDITDIIKTHNHINCRNVYL